MPKIDSNNSSNSSMCIQDSLQDVPHTYNLRCVLWNTKREKIWFQTCSLVNWWQQGWWLVWIRRGKLIKVIMFSKIQFFSRTKLKMWCLLVVVVGMAGGMEMEGDTAGDAANLDLDNLDLLDQHPSTIAGGSDTRLKHNF